MTDEKKKIKLFGKEVSVTEVPIKKRTEVPAEYELEDGSVIRFAVMATAVFRIDGEYDANNEPVYLVQNGQAVNVIKSGSKLSQDQDEQGSK